MLTGNGHAREQGALFDLAPASGGLDRVAARLERGLPGPAGYVLRRLLLVHYWHFDYEEIVVPHGRLFLLGENGSGKSTILGATIPLLLDGVLRPERLDTFGSIHRKIDHYVLGQTAGGGVAHQRRTSYVALEFAWHDPDLAAEDDAGSPDRSAKPMAAHPPFLTIGICLAGRAGTDEQVHPYRFVLTSGKRLGVDIPLKSVDGHVYDAAYFRSIIRDNGVVVERQSEYRDLVARHLFGYTDPHALDYLVDVLLLLRKPGLSNEIRTFDEVYDYLKRGLPPPPEEITRTTTEAFDRIDNLRHQGNRLRRQADAGERIHGADLDLARAKLRQRAWPVVGAERVALRRHDDVWSTRQALTRAERAQTEAQSGHDRLERDLAIVESELAELQGSLAAQELATLELVRRQAEEKVDLARDLLAHQESALALGQRALNRLRDTLAARERSWRALHGGAHRRLVDLAKLARQGAWPDGAVIADALARALVDRDLDRDDAADVPFALPSPSDELLPRVSERQQAVATLRSLHEEHDQRSADEQEAARRRQERQGDVGAAESAVAEARQSLAASWVDLATRLRGATVPGDRPSDHRPPADRTADDLPAAVAGARAAADQRDRDALRSALEALDRAARAVAERIDAELDRLAGEIGDLERRESDLAQAIARLRREPDQPPARLPHREQARAALVEAGVDARPFYSLVDFAPDLPQRTRGQIERALADAGILDALVLREGDSATAEALLAARGLADVRLVVSNAAPVGTTLDRVLIVDASVGDRTWRVVAERALGSVTSGSDRADEESVAAAILRPDGTWRHGLLAGYAGDDGPLGYIGAINRAQRWQRDLDARLAAQELLQVQIAQRNAARESRRRDQERLRSEVRALGRATDTQAVAAAETRLQEREATLLRLVEIEQAAAAELARRTAERERLTRQVGEAMAILGAHAPDRALVLVAERSLNQMAHVVEVSQGELARLAEVWAEYRRDRHDLAEADAQVVATAAVLAATRQQVAAAEESAARARERLATADLAAFQRQLTAARAREQRLRDELLTRREELGVAKNEVARLVDELSKAEARAVEADRDRSAAAVSFNALFLLNLDALEQSYSATEEAAVALAALLCPAEGTVPERLDREANAARDRRRRVFDEERSQLVDFDLAIAEDERDRVVVRLNDPTERPLPDLLRAIEGRIRENELLLNEAEERLFKDYLADTGLTAIHRAVQAADGLISRMNGILERTPLGRERYELRMEHRSDRLDQATPLARHHALFRKDPVAITEEERRVLFEAVRAAVAEAHRQAEAGEESFADLLARAFDYREWFSLGLFVTDGTGQRHRISSRMARTRSGAQQLFALYVPLFAALAAHYESAAPWSPKLFAMDEAFDKISEDNVTLLLRFLVDLGFQWIVASPRLSGAGRDVLPACADWQLYHNAKEELAQAIPVIYCDGSLLDLSEEELTN